MGMVERARVLALNIRVCLCRLCVDTCMYMCVHSRVRAHDEPRATLLGGKGRGLPRIRMGGVYSVLYMIYLRDW
jgi:hypothetical protein